MFQWSVASNVTLSWIHLKTRRFYLFTSFKQPTHQSILVPSRTIVQLKRTKIYLMWALYMLLIEMSEYYENKQHIHRRQCIAFEKKNKETTKRLWPVRNFLHQRPCLHFSWNSLSEYVLHFVPYIFSHCSKRIEWNDFKTLHGFNKQRKLFVTWIIIKKYKTNTAFLFRGWDRIPCWKQIHFWNSIHFRLMPILWETYKVWVNLWVVMWNMVTNELKQQYLADKNKFLGGKKTV